MISIFDFLAENKNTKASINLLVVQGSPRTKKSCSGGDSKTKFLMDKAIEKLNSNVAVDVLDLTVLDDIAKIQPCKGCIGTANGFQCHWPCTCYSPNDKNVPDLMHDDKVYERLEKADGFAIYTPVHWYACSTQIKAMFDRLVCCNLTLSVDVAKRLTNDDIKNPKKTIELEQSGKYDILKRNHLEGKVGAFFIHGNDGANDYKKKTYPLAMADTKHYITTKEAIMPIVLQCRYSGIFVPDHLIEAVSFGYDEPYSTSNKEIEKNKKIIDKSIDLLNKLADEIIKHRK